MHVIDCMHFGYFRGRGGRHPSSAGMLCGSHFRISSSSWSWSSILSSSSIFFFRFFFVIPFPNRSFRCQTEAKRTSSLSRRGNGMESNRIEPNRIEPNRIETNRTEPNRIESNRSRTQHRRTRRVTAAATGHDRASKQANGKKNKKKGGGKKTRKQ